MLLLSISTIKGERKPEMGVTEEKRLFLLDAMRDLNCLEAWQNII
jgi:hypothetical protein